ncbi:carboxymuconolactone decarboxylase [Planosporangium thailandense]|uniref:Carboxymuconolactone decarboxylase n=1 Tax=Planosporangium thailandense TaxID=765197 RepID=A0ABX0XVU0_9ACTN|nr:carboxymuconolactone decarboxylase family protein [Planosporangium thailandense]NJC69918.1 carboxymuconolactone decarboxylase [Planosporangium thailandense]
MGDVPVAGAQSDFDRGLKLIQQLGGVERPAVLDLFESLNEGAFGEECVGFIYGGVYHRPGLSLPARQLATVGALTALGYASAQLQFHAKAALNVGCSRRQIIESVIQVSSFAGFPATLNALTAVKAALGAAEVAEGPSDEADHRPASDVEDRYERGLRVMEQVDGDEGRKVVEALQDVAPDLARYIIEFTFGGIYTRPNLDLKHREIVTVAACAALGSALPQLKVHIHGLLNVGGTRQEVVETLLHVAFYCGFPAALNAMAAAREVFAERGVG